MALIYLDTSHLSLLASTYVQDPERFGKFVSAWRSRGHLLALSLFHLIELRGHGDKQIRSSRYAILKELLPLQFTVNPLSGTLTDDAADREILRALLLKGRICVKGPEAADWIRNNLRMFPHPINSREQVHEIRRFVESWGFGLTAGVMHWANKTGTSAQHRQVDEKYHSPKLTDLPESLELRPATALALKIFDWVARQITKRNVLPHDARVALEELRRFVNESRTGGVKSAYANFAHTKILKHERRRLDRITQGKLLKDHIRRVLSELLDFSDEAGIQKIMDEVRLEDCPGTWLKHHIDLEIRKAEHAPASSNAIDLEHIRYLPYVDLFTTDVRIANYARQVVRRGNLPEWLRPDSLPEAIPASIDALEVLINRDFTPPAPGAGRGSGG